MAAVIKTNQEYNKITTQQLITRTYRYCMLFLYLMYYRNNANKLIFKKKKQYIISYMRINKYEEKYIYLILCER